MITTGCGRVLIIQRAAQGRQPLQLVRELRVVDAAAVGHVDADHPQPAAVRAGVTRLRHPGQLPVAPAPGRSWRARPLRSSVRRRRASPIAQGPELGVGKRRVGALGLLQRHRVGRSGLQPVQQPGQPGPDRVDVPGRDAHDMLLPLQAQPVTPGSRSRRRHPSERWQAGPRECGGDGGSGRARPRGGQPPPGRGATVTAASRRTGVEPGDRGGPRGGAGRGRRHRARRHPPAEVSRRRPGGHPAGSSAS